MIHRLHELYRVTPCGLSREHLAAHEAAGIVTCLICTQWVAAPLQPVGPSLLHKRVDPAFVVTALDIAVNGEWYMAPESTVRIVAMQKHGDFYYAVTDDREFWPVDLPMRWR